MGVKALQLAGLCMLAAGLSACSSERLVSGKARVQGAAPLSMAEPGPAFAVPSPAESMPSGASAFLGDKITTLLSADDQRRAYFAQIEALDRAAAGAPVGWESPVTQHRGTIVVGPAYDSAGRTCRAYTHTVYAVAKPEFFRGTACRQDAAPWKVQAGTENPGRAA